MTLSHPLSPYLICYLNMVMVGELSVATHVKQMIDPDGDTSTELLGFKQRKREVLCASSCCVKLVYWYNVQATAIIQPIHSPAIPVIHNFIV